MATEHSVPRWRSPSLSRLLNSALNDAFGRKRSSSNGNLKSSASKGTSPKSTLRASFFGVSLPGKRTQSASARETSACVERTWVPPEVSSKPPPAPFAELPPMQPRISSVPVVRHNRIKEVLDTSPSRKHPPSPSRKKSRIAPEPDPSCKIFRREVERLVHNADVSARTELLKVTPDPSPTCKHVARQFPLQSDSSSSCDEFENSLIEMERSFARRKDELVGLLFHAQHKLQERADCREKPRGVRLSVISDPEDKSISSSVQSPSKSPSKSTSRRSSFSATPVQTSSRRSSSPKCIYSAHAMHFTSLLPMVRSYVSTHGLHDLHHDVLLAVLRDQPPKPWAFIAEYLNNHYGEQSSHVQGLTREALRCVHSENRRHAPPDIHEVVSECTAGAGNRQQFVKYAQMHNVKDVVQSAFTSIGLVRPEQPISWLRSFFLCRHSGTSGAFVPEWASLQTPKGEVYWLDLTSGCVQPTRPKEVSHRNDVRDLSDTSGMQAVIRDLRRGNIEPHDVKDWVRQRFMRKTRLLNCMVRNGEINASGWAGPIHEVQMDSLEKLERLAHSGHAIERSLLDGLSKVDVQALRMAKRVFACFAGSSADAVDKVAISKEIFVKLLTRIALIAEDSGEGKLFSLDSTLGEQLLRGNELTKMDAEAIFELAVAATHCATVKQADTVDETSQGTERPSMLFMGFLAALHMISKRKRTSLNDILTGVTFSRISPAEPALTDISDKSMAQRLKHVFKRFSGGQQRITALQWRKLCEECDVVNKTWGFTAADADGTFAAALARGSPPERYVKVKDAGMLLRLVSRRIGRPLEDVAGLVAWSFGPLSEKELSESHRQASS
eukprot:gnl/MRDRNA2_/MRDRNA2_57546_c0_seq1.p1 gnl/MRDRNA2_/MRDRNA2_57546_c0~~gnl/MRDRNA2_/MRDRNA2_57546_c0_seq1.p1  ORF type:complete len:839 (+),score=137.64 gnl/MRDRNA2_/MRDRNA2_57546_c0_seq1:107-2623(+)